MPVDFESQRVFTDEDPEETKEWLEAFDSVMLAAGPDRCRELLFKLHERARRNGISCETLLNTLYCNTIPPERQPLYPGNLDMERKITALIRWNALAMVMRSNRQGGELGGHLASYASSADLFETGFNHFFRGNPLDDSAAKSSDMVFFQPHSAPGVYARANLEGRLTEENLDHFRREVGGSGLCSYPHPRLMPAFWEFPTGSMGLGPITAIHQARFLRYLENRGLIEHSERKVWAACGRWRDG